MRIVKLPRSDVAYWITIAEMPSARRDLARLLTEAEIDRLFDHLAVSPECGTLIPGTGGLRKLYWRGQGKGKSKGIRVIYFYHDLNMPLFLLAVYGKGERLQLSKKEEAALARMADELRDEQASRNTQRFERNSA